MGYSAFNKNNNLRTKKKHNPTPKKKHNPTTKKKHYPATKKKHYPTKLSSSSNEQTRQAVQYFNSTAVLVLGNRQEKRTAHELPTTLLPIVPSRKRVKMPVVVTVVVVAAAAETLAMRNKLV